VCESAIIRDDAVLVFGDDSVLLSRIPLEAAPSCVALWRTGRRDQRVLVGTAPPGASPGTVFAFRPDGHMIWKTNLNREVVGPGGREYPRAEVPEDFFVITDIAIAHPASGQIPRPIVVVGRHAVLRELAFFAFLDPQSGKMEGRVWHVGSIRQMLLIDLDGDGVEEVVVSGVNTSGLDYPELTRPSPQVADGAEHLSVPVLFALSLERIASGRLPGPFAYWFEGGPTRMLSWYLMFPTSVGGVEVHSIPDANRDGGRELTIVFDERRDNYMLGGVGEVFAYSPPGVPSWVPRPDSLPGSWPLRATIAEHGSYSVGLSEWSEPAEPSAAKDVMTNGALDGTPN